MTARSNAAAGRSPEGSGNTQKTGTGQHPLSTSIISESTTPKGKAMNTPARKINPRTAPKKVVRVPAKKAAVSPRDSKAAIKAKPMSVDSVLATASVEDTPLDSQPVATPPASAVPVATTQVVGSYTVTFPVLCEAFDGDPADDETTSVYTELIYTATDVVEAIKQGLKKNESVMVWDSSDASETEPCTLVSDIERSEGTSGEVQSNADLPVSFEDWCAIK
ncbi:hypothetical protein UFOVP238_30 [uncultured Caudovirales phage]|uniref:Uncharacterized protein n=1 Tax=uncultured Caudovirales phage TaxID=2100421 RepID=A0A6J7WZA6_9CAUD|nr:hypothetical protein UFOVP238_30 [uncultured Caudovirales phage]